MKFMCVYGNELRTAEREGNKGGSMEAGGTQTEMPAVKLGESGAFQKGNPNKARASTRLRQPPWPKVKPVQV